MRLFTLHGVCELVLSSVQSVCSEQALSNVTRNSVTLSWENWTKYINKIDRLVAGVRFGQIYTDFYIDIQQQSSTNPAESRKLTLTFLPEPINSANIHKQSNNTSNEQITHWIYWDINIWQMNGENWNVVYLDKNHSGNDRLISRTE